MLAVVQAHANDFVGVGDDGQQMQVGVVQIRLVLLQGFGRIGLQLFSDQRFEVWCLRSQNGGEVEYLVTLHDAVLGGVVEQEADQFHGKYPFKMAGVGLRDTG